MASSAVGNAGSLRPVLCLRGATATGKTDLAVALARTRPVDVISVDSAMVYRGLDIGTAKPSAALRAEVPHALIDLCDPAEAYSAARFREDARVAIAASHARGRIPVLVGGTFLYFRALEEGLSDLPDADPAVRGTLLADAARSGWPALHRQLQRLDPEAAARIHPNDQQRLQRALEVVLMTGERISRLQRQREGPPAGLRFIRVYRALEDRAGLHARIESRFRAMLAQGLLEEVAALRARGDLGLNLPALRAVGYRQVWMHLEGAMDRDTMIARAIAATRQYAKRQIGWLRHDPHCGLRLPETSDQALKALQVQVDRLSGWASDSASGRAALC